MTAFIEMFSIFPHLNFKYIEHQVSARRPACGIPFGHFSPGLTLSQNPGRARPRALCLSLANNVI